MINTKRNIANLIYGADKRTRDDLIAGKIADERDYMSRLVTLVEYPYGWNSKYKSGFNSYFLSRTLPPTHERRFGCDVLFSFRYRNVVKLLCLESKKLDFQDIDDWDNFDQQTRTSRFTRQIKKQIALQRQGIIVYEMFLNDEFKYLRRPGYDMEGSSLVKHSIAHDHCINVIDSSPRKWFWRDADQIVRTESTLGISNLRTVIEAILDCRIGRTLGLNTSIGDGTLTLRINQEDFELPIPNLNDIRTNEPIWERLRRQAEPFMEKFGISRLAFFQDAESPESVPFFGS